MKTSTLCFLTNDFVVLKCYFLLSCQQTCISDGDCIKTSSVSTTRQTGLYSTPLVKQVCVFAPLVKQAFVFKTTW